MFQRGPTAWSRVGRWDVEAREFEPGAWIHARLFPRRSDLSPDGRYLCYFAHNPHATWEHRDTYVAVSKLPWLTALHAFGTCGTWTRGFRFTGDKREAEHQDLPIPFGLTSIPVMQFASERCHGWEEAQDSPPREAGGPWDDRRNARIEKRQPGGRRLLRAESVGHAGGEFGGAQAVDGLRVRYWIETGGDIHALDDLQWADWDGAGRLLAATRSGRLQIRDLSGERPAVLFDRDLGLDAPAPSPPPQWATRW